MKTHDYKSRWVQNPPVFLQFVMTLHMGHQTILCEIFSSEKSFMSRSYSLEPFMFEVFVLVH